MMIEDTAMLQLSTTKGDLIHIAFEWNGTVGSFQLTGNEAIRALRAYSALMEELVSIIDDKQVP